MHINFNRNPSNVKYEYLIIGKIPHYYSYFSLCDFIYFKNNKFDPVTYYSELALKKESKDSEQDLINLIKSETISDKENDSGFLDSFALNKYSIGRNKYQASINNILLSKLDFDSK